MAYVYIWKIISREIENEVKYLLSQIKYFPRKDRIFIKPNICGLYKSTSPCIVNPRVVGGIIEYLQENNYRDISLGETPVSEDAEKVFEISGYKKLCERYHVNLLDLRRTERERVKLQHFEVALPKFLLEGDYEYINVAKMKTHIQTVVSLCTKNQKGLLDFPDRKRMHIIGSLHENIKSLTEKIRPDFCLMDGINALEGDGPGRTGHEIRGLNVIMASSNIVDIDWIGAQVMGIDQRTITHLSVPQTNIEISAFRTEGVLKQFVLPQDHVHKLKIHFWFTERTCSGCSDIVGMVKSNIYYYPLPFLKLIYLAFWGRLDILTGDVSIPKNHGKIICLGDCMKERAATHNLPIAEGCPPDIKKLINLL